MIRAILLGVVLPSIVLAQQGLLSLFTPVLEGAAADSEQPADTAAAALEKLFGIQFMDLLKLPNGQPITAQNLLTDITSAANPINGVIQAVWQESIDARKDYLGVLSTLIDAPSEAFRSMADEAEAAKNPVGSLWLRPTSGLLQLLSFPPNLLIRPAKAALETEESFLHSAETATNAEMAGQQVAASPLRIIGSGMLNPIRLLVQPLRVAEGIFSRASRAAAGALHSLATEEDDASGAASTAEGEEFVPPQAASTDEIAGQEAGVKAWPTENALEGALLPEAINKDPPDDWATDPQVEALKEKIKSQLRERVLNAWASSLEREFSFDEE